MVTTLFLYSAILKSVCFFALVEFIYLLLSKMKSCMGGVHLNRPFVKLSFIFISPLFDQEGHIEFKSQMAPCQERLQHVQQKNNKKKYIQVTI